MGSYLVIFVVAATTAVVFMPLLLTIGHKIGALDNTRDPPVPRVGGLAIALGGGMALLLVGVIFAPTGSTLLATSRSLGPVMIGAGGILALGVLDDIHPYRASIKFGGQILIAIAVIAMGVRIELVSFPLSSIQLGPIFGFAVTVLWLVGITNAFNLLDGADGVAA